MRMYLLLTSERLRCYSDTMPPYDTIAILPLRHDATPRHVIAYAARFAFFDCHDAALIDIDAAATLLRQLPMRRCVAMIIASLDYAPCRRATAAN